MANKPKKLLAFHGKESIKQKYLKRVQAHYDADEIIHGIYWENGKGCAVGCTVQQNSNPHAAMETELGIPRTIAHLEDRIFEGLSNGEAKEFPLKFLNAITPGADLSLVTPKFMVWLLVDKRNGVLQYANTEKTQAAIKQVATLYKRVVEGDIVTDNEWQDAARAARAAYAATAAAADAAYAANAAAAKAAAYAAARAAYAAAYAAAYKQMAKKLLKLLAEAT